MKPSVHGWPPEIGNCANSSSYAVSCNTADKNSTDRSCTVQLNSNLMPTRGSLGEMLRVNLQKGVGKGAGACNILHQSGGHLFRYKFLKYVNTHCCMSY